MIFSALKVIKVATEKIQGNSLTLPLIYGTVPNQMQLMLQPTKLDLNLFLILIKPTVPPFMELIMELLISHILT